MQGMTTSAVRQRQDFPVGTQFAPTFLSGPQINLIPKTSADITAGRRETPVLARRRAFLQDQLDMVTQQPRSPDCAAAAPHVLERHPDTEVMIFVVKDGQPSMLANVLDGAGRYLPTDAPGTGLTPSRTKSAVDQLAPWRTSTQWRRSERHCASTSAL
jgi:hypothetical protein